MPRPSAETREHILEVARELFYWEGIRATGIDRVAAAANVAPTTLYRLFGSKDGLVAAYVERESSRFRDWFEAAIETGGSDPRKRILAVFDGLSEQVRPENCRGCPFLMALAEFPDAEIEAHRHAVDNKAWVRERFGELARELANADEVADAEALADRLALVMDGVYGSVAALGTAGPARQSRDLVESLLGASPPPPRRESGTG
jgi:AcrR family transcriptional regulator